MRAPDGVEHPMRGVIQEIVAPEPVAEAPVIDLMEALRQSVADAQGRRAAKDSSDGKGNSKAASRSRKAPAKKSA